MNNQLIATTTKDGKQTVDARDLWIFLGIKTEFAKWIKRRINECGFEENIDYKVIAKNDENSTGGRPTIEYHVSISMGKELGMLERNDKGREIRKYFIQIEKEFKEISSKPVPDSYMISDPIERGLKWIEEKKEMLRLEKQVKDQAPKVEVFQQALDSKTTHSIRDVSKLVNMMTLRKPFKPIGQNGLFRILRDNKILMKNNTPYQDYIDRGHFIVKVKTVTIGDNVINTTTTHVTFKGISAIILLLKKLGHKPCEVKS